MTADRFDPDDLGQVAAGLEASLRDDLGPFTLVEGPVRVGHGLDTYIYGFRLAGEGLPGDWQRPLILRVYPAPAQESKARREASVQAFLARLGYPVPEPLVVKGAESALGLPFMVMERAPGSPLLDQFKRPWAIPALLRRMAALHSRLHGLPLEGCPLPYEQPLVDRRLAEVRELVERFDLSDLTEPLDWLEANRGTVAAEEPALLHNDFHPLNLLLSEDDAICVLDWPDAAVGDRHHDLARTLALFWLAPPLSRNAVERVLLTALRGYLVGRYLACYEKQLPVDRGRVRYWQALHAAMAWAQVAALRDHHEELGAKPEAVQQVPEGFERVLKQYFRTRVSPG